MLPVMMYTHIRVASDRLGGFFGRVSFETPAGSPPRTNKPKDPKPQSTYEPSQVQHGRSSRDLPDLDRHVGAGVESLAGPNRHQPAEM